jgi:radical SAM superfamily enzyme
MEDHKKMFFIQTLLEVKVEAIKFHFKVNIEVHMVDITNMNISLMEVDEKTSEEKEVVEVVVEVIKVNNQIVTQTVTTTGNLGTC